MTVGQLMAALRDAGYEGYTVLVVDAGGRVYEVEAEFDVHDESRAILLICDPNKEEWHEAFLSGEVE